jgi:hypothetical protein
MRYMITDELWALLGPAVDQAKRNRCGQKPSAPSRPRFRVAKTVDFGEPPR